VKKNIPQKNIKCKQSKKIIKEEFSGKNLTRFGGSGLIRRFFKRHRIKEQIENRVKRDFLSVTESRNKLKTESRYKAEERANIALETC
jgi:hypothetical protein